MNYRSVSNLDKDIIAWLQQLPIDLEVIVGIPRSGLLAANLISLHRNLPLTDVDGLIEGRLFIGGPRGYKDDLNNFLAKRRKVLIVDDSISSGCQIKYVKERLCSANLNHSIYFGAVYIKSKRKNGQDVDYFYSCLSPPRCFGWNVMHCECLINTCVDIDGVLCRDPTEKENDDGERYRYFLENVKPIVIPSKTIGWLVTCRIEKYRALTECWLAKHGIKYNHLIMMNFPDKATRVASQSYSSFKASVYKKSGAELFIESSLAQASEIARLAKSYVLCTESMEMIDMNYSAKLHQRSRQFVLKRILHPWETVTKVFSRTRGLLKRDFSEKHNNFYKDI